MSLRISNGEQGRQFMSKTCELCAHDHDWHPVEVGPYKWEQHDGMGGSCPIMLGALIDNGPVDEWSYVDGRPTCTGYEPDEVCIGIREAYESGQRNIERTMGTWVSPYPVADVVAIHPGQLTIEGVA